MPNYPSSNYHFQVDWGGSNLGFSEVSGLEIEYDVIEYRDGNSPKYNTIKMPGRPKFTNIVLKRGIIPADNEFFEWLNSVQLNRVERRNVTISLLNEEHNPVMTWKAVNAFPVRLVGPTLSARGNEIAIEELEIAHEGLLVQSD